MKCAKIKYDLFRKIQIDGVTSTSAYLLLSLSSDKDIYVLI